MGRRKPSPRRGSEIGLFNNAQRVKKNKEGLTSAGEEKHPSCSTKPNAMKTDALPDRIQSRHHKDV